MSSTVMSSERGVPSRALRSDKPRYGEKVIYSFLFLTAVVSVAVTTGIVIALFQPLPGFFSEVSIVEFFTATE